MEEKNIGTRKTRMTRNEGRETVPVLARSSNGTAVDQRPDRFLSPFVYFAYFVFHLSWTSLACLAAPGDELAILPQSARLVGPHARQRFVVERVEAAVGVGDMTAKAVFASDNPRVAVVDRGGFVRPVGDGLATITATVDGRTARAVVSVEDAARDEPWSFRNHVEAVLTRQGCNAGACHGAAAGKNGFRLTLRGYAPEVDFAAMTRQTLGRRVVKTAPQESLILLKPTGAIEHGGGVRFTTESLEYRVISEWIAAGMPGPSATDPEVRALTILPAAVRLTPGQSQQVLVQATYSDGRVEDVTHWSKFASTDDGVASVDEHGRFKVNGRGEGYVSVWFASRVARVTVIGRRSTRSSIRRSSPRRPRSNPIDEKQPRQARLAADPALARRGRRGIPPPGVPRRDRHSADRRAGRGVPRGPLARPPRPAGRPPARQPRIRRLLGLQVVGPAARLVAEADGVRRCGRSTGSSASAWRRTCRGTSSPARS